MRSESVLRCFLAALAVGLVSAPARCQGIAWGGNYEKAFERAQSEAKPVLADFGATWCEPCAVMDRDVWSRADVAAAAARFVVVKIDIDVRADLVRTLGLEGAPTLILADPWGREIVRKVGYAPAEALLPLLAACPSDFSTVKPWVEALARAPEDPVTLAKLAEQYSAIGLFKLSNSFCVRAIKSRRAAEDPAFRESMALAIGLNFLRMRHFKEAQGALEGVLRDFPNGERTDVAYLGLVTSLLASERRDQATSAFEEMRRRFPSSSATRQAQAAFAAPPAVH